AGRGLSLWLTSHSSSDWHDLPAFPTRRSSDLGLSWSRRFTFAENPVECAVYVAPAISPGCTQEVSRKTTPKVTIRLARGGAKKRSEEHTSELQSRENLVCRLLLEKKNHGAISI